MLAFEKYHALGNDYLVLAPGEAPAGEGSLEPDWVRRVCDRHRGLGSDGILFGPLPVQAEGAYGLRIFNPDGSEAEKSGNGLRIFARYLYDTGRVQREPFHVDTPGGLVRCQVLPESGLVEVEMGRVSFDSGAIPVTGPQREVLEESLDLGAGEPELTFSAATIGNPHCVLLREQLSADEARRLGPLIECHPRFPNRTNVQFVRVLDRANLQLEIWERGAGYTLASGSSSSAAAAVARRLGKVDAQVTAHMPGGALELRLDDAYGVTMRGPVTRVAAMQLDPEALT